MPTLAPPPPASTPLRARLVLRPSLVGLVGAVLGIVLLVLLDDTGHLGWAVSVVTRVPLGDKVGHFIGFGTLAFFAARVFPSPRVARVPVVVLVLLVLTGLEELSQAWIPWRHCDGWDFVADTLGMATMTALALALPARSYSGAKARARAARTRREDGSAISA